MKRAVAMNASMLMHGIPASTGNGALRGVGVSRMANGYRPGNDDLHVRRVANPMARCL